MSKRNLSILSALIAIAAAAWIFWRPAYSSLENLDSDGTTIVAFGDSLTAGYGAGKGEDYPSRLGEITGFAIINAGVSGDTTASALARIDRSVMAHDPRIVIVGLGGNDFLRNRPIEDTERDLREIIGKIHESGSMVILLGFRFPSLRVSYEDMYERVADDTGSLLIADVMDGILSTPELRSDAIHPNASGYQLMAERIAPELQAVVDAAE